MTDFVAAGHDILLKPRATLFSNSYWDRKCTLGLSQLLASGRKSYGFMCYNNQALAQRIGQYKRTPQEFYCLG